MLNALYDFNFIWVLNKYKYKLTDIPTQFMLRKILHKFTRGGNLIHVYNHIIILFPTFLHCAG